MQKHEQDPDDEDEEEAGGEYADGGGRPLPQLRPCLQVRSSALQNPLRAQFLSERRYLEISGCVEFKSLTSWSGLAWHSRPIQVADVMRISKSCTAIHRVRSLSKHLQALQEPTVPLVDVSQIVVQVH